MAYAQWVSIKIIPKHTELTVKHVKLDWGKFHAQNDKDKEIDRSKIEGKKATPDNPLVISACGRSNASSGTTGSFQLWDGGTLVATYAWDCPWGSKRNTSTLTAGPNERYTIQQRGANLDSGALGNVRIDCVYSLVAAET